MKTSRIFLTSVIVLALGGGAVHLYDNSLWPTWYAEAKKACGISERAAGSHQGNNVMADEWADAAVLQKKLELELMAKMKDIAPSAMRASLEEPQNRLLLAQWLMTHALLNDQKKIEQLQTEQQKKVQELQKKMDAFKAKGALHARDERKMKLLSKQLAQHEKEASQPLAMHEVLKSPEKKALLQVLGNNLDWLEQMVYSGQMTGLAKVVNILNDIQKQHPDMLTNQMVRDIATATALEFAKSGWLHDVAVDRADFYISHWKNDDLNTIFDTLPFWERRMVCGSKADTPFAGRPSLEWALENVHLPADRYTQDCPHHLYRLHNLYGYSVHGANYEAPYADLYENNMCQFVQEVGGICGSLSHFSTYSALANGIPALTVGEPGHCSYIIKEGDKWPPAILLIGDAVYIGALGPI